MKALIERVEALTAANPRSAVGLAEIAVELLRRFDKPGNELRAHALCALATAQRWAGKLFQAEITYRRVEAIPLDGYPQLAAMLWRQKAMLLLERGDLDGALELASRAVEIDRRAGIRSSKSLTIKGIVLAYRKDAEGSLACFRKVVESCEPEGNDYLFATSNLIAALLHRPLLVDEVSGARATLREIQERIRGVRHTPIRYMVWRSKTSAKTSM